MSTKTVTVACKLPSGLNIGPLGDSAAPVILNGAKHGTALGAGGFGLTPNVPAEAFAKWLEDHKDFEPVKQGLIFTNAKRDFVVAQAVEQTDARTGFERLDPDAPPPGIEETDESKKNRRSARLRTTEANLPPETE